MTSMLGEGTKKRGRGGQLAEEIEKARRKCFKQTQAPITQ